VTNLEYAEKAVLGAILLRNECFDDVTRILSETDFSLSRNRIVFRAIGGLLDNGSGVDLLTLTDHLRDAGELKKIGAEYVVHLTSVVPTAANVEYYARVVRDESVRRTVSFAVGQLAEKISDPGLEVAEVVEEAERVIFEVNQQRAGDYVKIDSVLGKAMDRVEEYVNTKGSLTGIPSGLTDIDAMTGGFQNGEMYVVGARASIGKTAFALTAALNIMKVQPTAFFSLEMSNEILGIRLLAMEGRVDSHKIRSGFLSFDDVHKLTGGASRMCGCGLYLYDQPNAGIADIKSKLRRMVSRDGVKIAFIDYVGLVKPEKRDIPRHEQVSLVSKDLKQMSRELNIPIIVLAQLNRLAEGKRPNLSELKESGALEEDADCVILLHRDRDDDEAMVVPVEAHILKQRNGPTGKVEIAFHKRYTRFENLAREREQKTA
jgi:replicative DNA helicase